MDDYMNTNNQWRYRGAERREYTRNPYRDIQCLVRFLSHESITALIIDASVSNAFLRIYSPPKDFVPDRGTHGTIVIDNLQVPFMISRASSEAYYSKGDTWIAVRFDEPSESFLQRLDDILASRLRASPYELQFESKIGIEEGTFLDAVIQMATLYTIIDASTHITLILQEKGAVDTRPTIRPRLLRINSFSPVKGAVEIAQGVMSVVKSAYDLIRHRKANNDIKKEEVFQKQQQSRMDVEKVHQEASRTIIAETDALVKSRTADYEILSTRMEILKKEVEISQLEVHLYRERLAALTDGWRFAVDVFGDDSEELNVLKKRLLPSITWLFEDTAGLHLEFKNEKRGLNTADR